MIASRMKESRFVILAFVALTFCYALAALGLVAFMVYYAIWGR